MGDTDRGPAFQQTLQFVAPRLNDDGIAGTGPILLGFKLVPYRKNQLSVLLCLATKTGYIIIERRRPGQFITSPIDAVDQGFAGQSLPGDYPLFCSVGPLPSIEWNAGVVELWRANEEPFQRS